MKASLFSLLLVITAAVALPLTSASADELNDVRDVVSPVDLTLDRWQPGAVVRTTVVPNTDPRVGAVTTRTLPTVPYGAANPEDFPAPAPCPPPPPGCDPYLPAYAPPAANGDAAAPAPAAQAPPRLERSRRTPDESCDPACAQRRDDCCWPLDWCGKRYGCWDITLEGTYGFPSGPEGLMGEPAFAVNQYDWGQQNYTGMLGARGSLKRQLRPGTWLEIRGFGTTRRNETSTQAGVFGFRPPVGPPPIPPIFASNTQTAVLASTLEMFGAELNYIREMDCSGCTRWDIVVGARWIDVDEVSTVNWAASPIAGGGPAFLDSRTKNRMFGGQIGVIGHWDLSPRFELIGALKGILANNDRTARVGGANVFVGGPFRSTDRNDTVNFGVDIDVSVKWRITPRFALTAGYNLLFIDNAYRSYSVMDFSQAFSGAVQATGVDDQLTVHTLFAGVNFNF